MDRVIWLVAAWSAAAFTAVALWAALVEGVRRHHRRRHPDCPVCGPR